MSSQNHNQIKKYKRKTYRYDSKGVLREIKIVTGDSKNIDLMLIIGSCFGLLTLSFLFLLILTSSSNSSACYPKTLLVLATSLGGALSIGLIGGASTISGVLPVPEIRKPPKFAMRGGGATFVIMFAFLILMLPAPSCDSVHSESGSAGKQGTAYSKLFLDSSQTRGAFAGVRGVLEVSVTLP